MEPGVAGSGSSAAAAAGRTPAPPFRVQRASQVRVTTPEDLGVALRRSAAARVDRSLLPGPAARRQVTLDLFEDVSFVADVGPRDDDGLGPVWRGKLVSPQPGALTLVLAGRRLYGSIRTESARYVLLPRRGGGAHVGEIDLSARLPDRALVPPVSRTGRRTIGQDRKRRSTLDLLVLFTPAAKKQEPPWPGGLKGLIRVAVAEMNTALANSEIDIQVRLVKIKRVGYEKSGEDQAFMSGALADLTRPGDGHMDKAQRLRDRFGADFVQLIIQRNISACGMGWIGGARQGLETADGDFAFSVTAWRCLLFDTLAHELGHNMGAQHSRLDPVSARAGAYDYSYGHKIETKIQTIMAYSCESPCVSPLAYSNPDVAFEGIPAGVPVGSAQPADNRRSFNNDRRVMEAYRPCAWKCE